MERGLVLDLGQRSPEFCEVRQECVQRDKDWSAKGLSEDMLHPTTNRIIRLAAARLTIEHVGLKKGIGQRGCMATRRTG